jgi:hypothetical protein
MSDQTTTETNGHAPEPTIAPPLPPSKSLLAALVVAQHEANPVTKSARNTFHNYNYASADAIIQEAGEALSAAGLAAFPVSIERDPAQLDHVWKMGTDKEGKPEEFIDIPRRVRMVLCVVHGATGESREFVSSVPVLPEKGRPEDKAEFGARTEMLAYALRDLLLLPRLAEGTPSARNDTTPPPARDWNKNPPKGQAQPPKAQAAQAPAADTAGAATASGAGQKSASPGATTSQKQTSASIPAADPEHTKTLVDIRNCVGNDLKWEDKKARETCYELFGVGVPSKLSKAQAALFLQLLIEAADSEDAFLAALAKARAATPDLFVAPKGVAA